MAIDASSGGAQHTTSDSLLDGQLILNQPEKGYRVSVDAVLLAASVNPQKPGKLLELGCGVGAASLCLLRRYELQEREKPQITGLEVQGELAELARRNARENGFEGQFRVLNGDLKQPPPVMEPISFDEVFFNPPYDKDGKIRRSSDPMRDLANHEGDTKLEHWMAAAQKYLKPRGRLTLIHRADRMDEVLRLLTSQMGAIQVLPIHTKAQLPAKRIVVRSVKSNSKPLEIMPGFVLHRENGAFTFGAQMLLSGACGFTDFYG